MCLCIFVLEREENVKSDIFNAYIALLRQTRPISSPDVSEVTGAPDR